MAHGSNGACTFHGPFAGFSAPHSADAMHAGVQVYVLSYCISHDATSIIVQHV